MAKVVSTQTDQENVYLVVPSTIWTRLDGIFPATYTEAEKQNIKEAAELWLARAIDDAAKRFNTTRVDLIRGN